MVYAREICFQLENKSMALSLQLHIKVSNLFILLSHDGNENHNQLKVLIVHFYVNGNFKVMFFK